MQDGYASLRQGSTSVTVMAIKPECLNLAESFVAYSRIEVSVADGVSSDSISNEEDSVFRSVLI